uniref:Peptidase M13 N-terminal domain-containing protein n=1 Tax=Glossina brevipalpis TaxID=37001 RepID=A0A1A9WAX5_9MUSC
MELSSELEPCNIGEEATYTIRPDESSSVRIHPRSLRINRRNWPVGLSILTLKYMLLVATCVCLGAALSTFIMQYTQNDKDCPITALQYHDVSVCLSESCVEAAFHLLESMNTSVDPCEDFYQYACGNWKREHPVPEADTSISTFKLLGSKILETLKRELEEPIIRHESQAVIKAKEFYESCTNTEKIQNSAEDRLKEILKSFGGWPVIEGDNWQFSLIPFEEILGELHRTYNVPVLLDLLVGTDEKNSSAHILKLDESPLPLYSRDAYLDPHSEKVRQAYHNYMIETAVLLGANREIAAQELDQVLQFEIQLANLTLRKEDRRDVSGLYNKMSLPELQIRFPELNWPLYLQTFLGSNARLDPNEELVIYGIEYLTGLTKLTNRTDKRTLQNFALWRLVRTVVVFLPDKYQKHLAEFHRVLLGVHGETFRWVQCVMWTNRNFGLAVGALFVKNNFDPKSREIASDMISTIREAFNELLDENNWMDDVTRAVAKEKADAMNQLIGYPDILTNITALENEYQNLTIVSDNFMDNVYNILRWEIEKNLQLLRKPVEKKLIPFNPTAINAYYDFHTNDIGRQFDKDGNMLEWWNNATIEAFRQHTQCIIDQYSNYKVAEVDLNLNGRMTQGENIADNGGLKQAFRAYKKWVKRHGPEPLLPAVNLRHDQIFFVNFAQMWCETERPEALTISMAFANHPPGDIRVRGTLSNSIEFANTYHCPPGSAMNPIKKCTVW